MRYPQALIISGGVILVIAASALAVAAQTIRPMASTRDKARQLNERLDRMIEETLDAGCSEHDEGDDRPTCRESRARIDELHDQAARNDDELRARPAELRAGAVNSIKKFRGRDDLAVTYRSTSPNPYRDDGSVIETYVDDQAYEYWIDPSHDRLVQMGPHAGADQAPHQVRPENRLPVSTLRAQALSLIEAAVPEFPGRRSSLHPLEDNKGKRVYFFRWDDFSSPLKGSELPPFVQVGIYADGHLASYTNTLNK